jgi:hypothetical protein
LTGSSRRTTWVGVAGAALALGAAAGATLGQSEPIAWRALPATALGPQTSAEREQVLVNAARPGGPAHVIAQFTGPVAPDAAIALEGAGVQLLRYLGGHAYFAVVNGDQLDPAVVGFVAGPVSVRPLIRECKLHRDLAEGQTPPWAELTTDAVPLVVVSVLLHADVNLATAGPALAERCDATIQAYLRSVNGLVLNLARDRIAALVEEDCVQWVEPPLPGFVPVNDSSRALTQATQVAAPPYNLTGAGVNVLLYDGGLPRATHVDFQGRVHIRDSGILAGHSTHVAGTIAGGGIALPQYRGYAPGVSIQAYAYATPGGAHPGVLYTDPGDLEADYDNAINVRGVALANNSIGSNIELNGYDCTWQGDYGVTDALIDAIVHGSLGRPIPVIWAAGNERQGSTCDVEGFGAYYSMAPPAGAKNIICVGAVNSNDDSMTWFSSWGPVDDGRLRPDVVAPGCQTNADLGVTSCYSTSDTAYASGCGTSMAAPAVTGICALLLEDYRARYPGQPDPRNATFKALLAHTAVDLGPAGPDYQYGYGSVRALAAVDCLRTGSFLESAVTAGQTYALEVRVASGAPELRVTLAWDDVPGTPNVMPSLVNDLDLRVFDPSGARHYPWTLNPLAPSAPAVRTDEDHRNNLEQVFVANPAVGRWRVEVRGTSVPMGPQSFSVCTTPALVACSKTGLLTLDQPAYACNGTVKLRVVDCDLNQNETVVETASATVASTSTPGGVPVTLVETGPNTNTFAGAVNLTFDASATGLRVAPGDVLTAVYTDADNGLGGSNVPVVAHAGLDCVAPQVSAVSFTDVGGQSVTLTFVTDEPSIGAVEYGLACTALTGVSAESQYATNHVVHVDNLASGVRYYLHIRNTDAAGNVGVLDNAGQCFAFTTPAVQYAFPLDTNPGWSTQGAWAWGGPGGAGSFNGDPTSGHTGTTVYGYNLAGDYTNNLAATYLTTPPFDCTGLHNVRLSFWRWLGVESISSFDDATVELSTDGVNWTTLWAAHNAGESIADTAWTYQELDLGALADGRAAVQLRWGMGPTDGEVTYPGWNIDDIRLLASTGGLALGLPSGVPTLLIPGVPTPIAVRIAEGDEQYVANSGFLHVRYAETAAFTSVPLTHTAGDLWQALLPAAHCGDQPQFYFAASGTLSGEVRSPADAPATFYSAAVGQLSTVFADNFETNLGWTVSGNAVDGQWTRGAPVNGGRADPPADYDGSGRCYVTDNVAGNSDVDGGTTNLNSPALSVAAGDVISYAYWINDLASSPATAGDGLRVDYATNAAGTNWTTARNYAVMAGSWRVDTLRVGVDVQASSTFRLRFACSDIDPASIIEGGVDAVLITRLTCSGACDDGVQNQGEARIDCGGPCPACECLTTAACDDGDPCTGVESCDAWGHCQPGPIVDCNHNGRADNCDIAGGMSYDDNANGVPDECEPHVPGDANCDGAVTFDDINAFVQLLTDVNVWRAVHPGCLRLNGDCNHDGKVDFSDINPFVALLTKH